MLLNTILIILSAAVTLINANCSPCPPIPKHYEELGCKGIMDRFDCCPTRFNCPDFKDYEPSKCYYKGNIYDVESQLKDETPQGFKDCTCSSTNDTAGFNCLYIECPELLELPKPSCIRQYSLEKPCSINTICDEDEIQKLHKCFYRGTTYYDGQFIYPTRYTDICYKCLCNENYSNETMAIFNNNCQKIECVIELFNLDKYQLGCVPIYYGPESCCPIDYKCPTDEDAIEPSDRELINPIKACSFGNLVMPVGDALVMKEKCVNCQCTHPPMISCTKIENCENNN